MMTAVRAMLLEVMECHGLSADNQKLGGGLEEILPHAVFRNSQLGQHLRLGLQPPDLQDSKVLLFKPVCGTLL